MPKDLSKFKIFDLKYNYYCNANFINLLNVAYYHLDTSTDDSSNIKGLCIKIEEAFKKNDRNTAITNLKSLYEVLNRVADYQGWDTIAELKEAAKVASIPLVQEAKKTAVAKYDKDKKDSNNKLNDKLKGQIKSDLRHKDTEEDIIKEYTSDKYGYSADYVQKHIEAVKKELTQESFDADIKDLIKLCETALE